MNVEILRPSGCGVGEPWPRDQLILEAAIYATRMHGEQKRKYTGEPYMVHCFEVANWVASVTDDATMIAAALLHDVVEDTEATQTEVTERFGDRISTLVYWLTDQSRPEDGNRATRKLIDRNHSGSAPADAKTVKLADLCSNTQSITQHDPGFAVVYLKEKMALLELLTDGDNRLWMTASQFVEQGWRRIGKEPR